jgi:hypothetical protein
LFAAVRRAIDDIAEPPPVGRAQRLADNIGHKYEDVHRRTNF